MIVDVITDASYCPENKFGTFAFYIKSSSGTISTCGILKNAVNSLDAELKAIANAIHALRCSSLNRETISYIRIHSDCLNSFKYITRKTKDPAGKLIINEILKIKKKSNNIDPINIFYNLHHVKAHTDLDDDLSLGNKYCHDMAYKLLKTQREKLKCK